MEDFDEAEVENGVVHEQQAEVGDILEVGERAHHELQEAEVHLITERISLIRLTAVVMVPLS